MDIVTTTLLAYRPSDERIEELVDEIAAETGEPGQTVSYLLSEELPPIHTTAETDQFLAHKRDHPDALFLTVLCEDTA